MDLESKYLIIKGFYHVDYEDFRMSMHQHENWEIMYVFRGSCDVIVEEHTLHLIEKQFIFLAANTPHRIIIHPQKPCTITNLEFVRDHKHTSDDIWVNIDDILQCNASFKSFLDAESQRRYIVYHDDKNIYSCLRELISELCTNKQDSFYLAQVLFLRLMMVIVMRSSSKRAESGIGYIRRAKEYINLHYQERITLDDVAEQVDLNSEYLSRLFKKYENRTISKYILEQRLQRAAFLLLNSESSITDISFEAGFNSRQYFYRAFTARFGVTPIHYRKGEGAQLPRVVSNG